MGWLTLIVALTATATAPPASDPDQFPFALHRGMEIDDLDREAQRLHDTALLKRAQLAASQRLAQRGLMSRGDLERELADLRSLEAREAESIAYRALKAHERDVLGQAAVADEYKTYSLILDWIRKQAAIARVDLDYQSYLFRQTQALFQRNAVNRQELEDVESAVDRARAGLALSQSREAQVLMELAARDGKRPYDPAEYHRLKGDYLRARVRYFEVTSEGAQRRLEVARDRQRIGLFPASDLPFFEKAAADASASLEAEKRTLAAHEASKPSPIPPPRRRPA